METRADHGTRVPARVWRGTAGLLLARVVGTLASLATLGLLARHLDGATFGRLTFWLALLLFLEGFVDCGTSTAALQRGAGRPEALAGAIAAGRRLRAGAALLALLVVATLAARADEPDLGWILLAAAAPLTRALELSALRFHAEIRWRVPVLVRSGAALLRLGAALLLIGAGVEGFGPYLAAHAAIGGAGNLLLHRLARPGLVRGAEPDRGLWRAAAPVAVLGVVQQAYLYADNLVLRALTDDVEVGRYNACVRLFSVLVLVAGLATNAALPWLVERARAGELRAAALRLGAPLLGLGTAAALLLLPLAPRLLAAIYGAEFAVAAPSLRWLVAAALVVSVGSVSMTAALAASRSVAVLLVAAGGLALNLWANLRLVPSLGIEGAAVATFATELFVALACLGVLLGLRSGRSASGPAGRRT